MNPTLVPNSPHAEHLTAFTAARCCIGRLYFPHQTSEEQLYVILADGTSAQRPRDSSGHSVEQLVGTLQGRVKCLLNA